MALMASQSTGVSSKGRSDDVVKSVLKKRLDAVAVSLEGFASSEQPIVLEDYAVIVNEVAVIVNKSFKEGLLSRLDLGDEVDALTTKMFDIEERLLSEGNPEEDIMLALLVNASSAVSNLAIKSR